MKQVIYTPAVVDIDAADDTSAFSMDMPLAGKLLIDQCWARYEEASGTQTSAQGVVSIEVGGTEVATFTADQSQSIGHAQTFTPDGTNATSADPYYDFSAGDAIEGVTKTQASGGTTTGTVRIFLAIELAQ